MMSSSIQLTHQGRSIAGDVLEWDVTNWTPALEFWRQSGCHPVNATVLDLGSRRGGLSLLFALNGAQVICSDLEGPAPEAKELHDRFGVANAVTYRALNATKLDVADNSQDIVCFKSILGGIGRNDNFSAQQKTMSEIRRVLKPGGWLFFAENQAASSLHQYLRKKFVPWGAAWRYVHCREFPLLLQDFTEVKIETWGFAGAFGRQESHRRILGALDKAICPLVRQRSRYIAFGHARKPTA